MDRRWICMDCGFIGLIDEFDRVRDPGGSDVWTVCRKCRTPEQVTMVCDEPGCNREATCGFLSETVYRHTCGDHADFMRELSRPKPHQAGPPT